MSYGAPLSFTFLFQFIWMGAFAQALPAEGEYYLTGVPETASGFKLNADSSFAFFFSYGALDRFGNGTWKQTGNRLLLQSKPPEGADFTLLDTKKTPHSGLKIQIQGGDPAIYAAVSVELSLGAVREQQQANALGVLNFKQPSADQLKISFAYCPEKQTIIRPVEANELLFRIEPRVMEYQFNSFELILTPDGLRGPHPLDSTRVFNYQKGK